MYSISRFCESFHSLISNNFNDFSKTRGHEIKNVGHVVQINSTLLDFLLLFFSLLLSYPGRSTLIIRFSHFYFIGFFLVPLLLYISTKCVLFKSTMAIHHTKKLRFTLIPNAEFRLIFQPYKSYGIRLLIFFNRTKEWNFFFHTIRS